MFLSWSIYFFCKSVSTILQTNQIIYTNVKMRSVEEVSFLKSPRCKCKDTLNSPIRRCEVGMKLKNLVQRNGGFSNFNLGIEFRHIISYYITILILKLTQWTKKKFAIIHLQESGKEKREQGEPENPKDKPDTRKPIFNVRLVLRVHFVIWVTTSIWEPKRTSNGNLLPSLSRIRLSCIQLIRLLFFSNRHHTLKNRQNTQK